MTGRDASAADELIESNVRELILLAVLARAELGSDDPAALRRAVGRCGSLACVLAAVARIELPPGVALGRPEGCP